MEERKNIFDTVGKVADVKNVVDGIALNMSLGGGDTTRVVSTEDLHIESGTKVKMIIL